MARQSAKTVPLSTRRMGDLGLFVENALPGEEENLQEFYRTVMETLILGLMGIL